MENGEEEVISRSLYLAKKYLKEDKPGRSFAHLLVVLKLKPQWKDKLESLMITAISGWEKDLLASGRYTELFSCYEVALEYYQNHILYNNLENDIFIVNNISVNRVLTDKTFFKFMDISEESDLSVVSPHEDDCLMKVLQKEINELCSEKTENSYYAVFSKLCSPKVFGMILGYPVVYNVNNNNFSTFNLIPLVSVKVFIEYEGKPYEIYSFSYILIHNFTEHVDKWFNNLKLQFKMFNFKLSKENVTANVVL
uniref:Uncharacterized protein n=1 Tax=Rhodnius prolixus TaxID=13249 RepID=T1HPG4_RHOPR